MLKLFTSKRQPGSSGAAKGQSSDAAPSARAPTRGKARKIAPAPEGPPAPPPHSPGASGPDGGAEGTSGTMSPVSLATLPADVQLVKEMAIPELSTFGRKLRPMAARDGHRLDPEFAAACCATVAAERGDLVAATCHRCRRLGGAVAGEDSLVTASPSRLQSFFAADGAVYAQYDLWQPAYSGGSLPDGWAAVRSRKTGKTYYANSETGATQWDPPLYPLGPDWRAAQSPQSGAVFYEHKGTGQWRWTRPVDEQFLELQRATGSDALALQLWRERAGARADGGFAGLDAPPAARTLTAPPRPAALALLALAATAPAGPLPLA